MSGTIQGERPPPEVSARRRFSRSQVIALYTLGTGAVIAFVFWRNPGGSAPEPERPSQQSIRQLVRPEILEQPRLPPIPAALPGPPPPAAVPPASPSPIFQTIQQPAARRNRMVNFPLPAAPASPASAPAVVPEDQARTSVGFRSQPIQGGRASQAMDQTYLLMPGIYRCTLDTAVSSEQSGPFLCHTSENIYSPLGVLLMERGTRVVGQYQNSVRQGQSRIPALSVAAYTPNGVPVPLGAQMSDGLGRVGLDGERDTHFWDRFGGATLLLLSQGVMGAAQAALQSGSGNTYLNLGGGGYQLQGVIAETLRNSINIPPTITKNQGEEVAFFVTAPISFADAYQLRVQR